ncbi:MAG TPA: GDP-mannose 4,6-dehydratase [Candidatus Binatia bacterium]|nr:GDP-mannose 4,6-dehydratase [Candidatus Binatia bacterium]
MAGTAARKIAVLGSNSFSGSDFVDLLLEDERNTILGVSRSPEKSELFLPYLRHKSGRYRFEQADFNRDMDRLLTTLDDFAPDYIVNFAAQSEVAPSWEHPDHWFETNTVALARLINHIKARPNLKRYVHISSPEVYGPCEGTVLEDAPYNPSTPYAASKAAADLLLLAFSKNFPFPLVTVRATNVYGAHQQLFKIIPRSAINIKLGKKIELHGGGVAVKSYIHIRDVSRGELAAMERGRVGEIYHFSPDRGYEVREVVSEIAQQMGFTLPEVSVNVAERLGQDKAYVIDSTKARTELGWAPIVSLQEGLRGVIEWVDRFWTQIQREPLDYVHKA